MSQQVIRILSATGSSMAPIILLCFKKRRAR